MTARSLPVLLALIDAKAEEPFLSNRIIDAVQAGIITGAEARHLQAFERRPVKARSRMVADAVDVSPEAIAMMRARAAELSVQLRERSNRRGGSDVA